MNEFKRIPATDCFKPVWNESDWNLYHLLNGKTYLIEEIAWKYTVFFGNTLANEYAFNAVDEAFDPLWNGFFMLQWLEKIHDIVSVNYAESKRLEYLAANPSKGKQSEGIYTAALQEANNFYRNLK